MNSKPLISRNWFTDALMVIVLFLGSLIGIGYFTANGEEIDQRAEHFLNQLTK